MLNAFTILTRWRGPYVSKSGGSSCFFMLILQGCIASVDSNLHHMNANGSLLTPPEIIKTFPEQKYLKSEEPLALGMALSGGGVRCASFSIGAKSGLYSSGVLNKIDAISTVSGGGYAGYWYMNQLYSHRDDAKFRLTSLVADCPDRAKGFCA